MRGAIMKRLAVATAVVLVACSDSTGPKHPVLSGTWQATLASTGSPIVPEIQEANGIVTGSADLSVGGSMLGFDVSGSHDHPSVTLTLTRDPFDPVTVDGSFTDDATIDAHITGAGVDESLSLNRVAAVPD